MLVKELFEARKPELTYTPLEIKGKVERITVTLEGKESGLFTRLAKGYKKIDMELAKLEAKRNILNRVTKENVLAYYDAEDEVFTRVVETISLTATVSKLSKPNDKVDHEKVIEALLKLQPELEEQIKKLQNQFTSTPKAKAPSLAVKMADPELAAYEKKMKKYGAKVEEGVADLWASFKAKASALLSSVTSWGKSYDKKLAAAKAMMGGSVTESHGDFKKGDTVRLKKPPKATSIPQGRENNYTAKITGLLDHGGLKLDRDLHGAKWWNVDDVKHDTMKEEAEIPKLTVKNGELHLHGHILLVMYRAGDCDSIPWPFKGKAEKNLYSALYDARETGELEGNEVLLPNGKLFKI